MRPLQSLSCLTSGSLVVGFMATITQTISSSIPKSQNLLNQPCSIFSFLLHDIVQLYTTTWCIDCNEYIKQNSIYKSYPYIISINVYTYIELYIISMSIIHMVVVIYHNYNRTSDPGDSASAVSDRSSGVGSPSAMWRLHCHDVQTFLRKRHEIWISMNVVNIVNVVNICIYNII